MNGKAWFHYYPNCGFFLIGFSFIQEDCGVTLEWSFLCSKKVLFFFYSNFKKKKKVYLPMSYIYGVKPEAPKDPIVKELREEIWCEKYEDVDWSSVR